MPFPGGTTADKARAHCSVKPLDPRRLNHQLSDPFVDVIADMMAKDPALRISTALEVVERLAPWTRNFQERQQSGTAFVPVAPPQDDRPVPASALAATTVAPLEPLPPPVDPDALPRGFADDMSANDQRYNMPVVPPPVITQPIAEWNWDGAAVGDSPPLTTTPCCAIPCRSCPLRGRAPSESDMSISMVVEPPRRIPLWLLVTLVGTPVALGGLVLLVSWLSGR